MDPVALPALQTATPGVGPQALGDVWPPLVRVGWFLAGFLVVASLGWYVVEPTVSRAVRRRNRGNPTLQEAVTRYVRLAVLLVATYVAAAAAGYGGFLGDSALVIAAGTLAVGVAGQAVIGSIVSGLALVADPEFNVGDYIEWADGEGEVRSITLRVTRVRTPNDELVTVPNTSLTEGAITRPYGRGRYRIVEHVGLDYDDDLGDAVGELEAAATALDEVLDHPAPSAYVDDFASDEVVLRVHYWIEDPSRRNVLNVRSAYARAAKARLDGAGLTIAPASKRDLRGGLTVEERGPA